MTLSPLLYLDSPVNFIPLIFLPNLNLAEVPNMSPEAEPGKGSGSHISATLSSVLPRTHLSSQSTTNIA